MKPMISHSDVEFYLEQVYGAIVIDHFCHYAYCHHGNHHRIT